MENFLRENLDILKEIGSIGMGHASTSLSHMLNMKVTMTTPAVYIMTTAEAREYLGRHGQESLGVRLGLQGDAKGKILQIHSKKFALHVINYFFQGGLEEISELDEMSFSVLQEI
ncbi:MAG: chemotaxis protein CheC, partial [Oscillospiraceae bacterium]|nr:chemotaxis protein CheC [Oscillospiraceae bacterium]